MEGRVEDVLRPPQLIDRQCWTYFTSSRRRFEYGDVLPVVDDNVLGLIETLVGDHQVERVRNGEEVPGATLKC